jgi:hypothetical protein
LGIPASPRQFQTALSRLRFLANNEQCIMQSKKAQKKADIS